MQNLSQPIQSSQRVIVVDVLRGWALLGVVLMNYFDFFTFERDWAAYKPDTFTNVLMYVLSLVFAAKSWTLLSLLFGYGFAVVMTNVERKGLSSYGFFTKRMFWLLILSIINSALFFGDILKDYAILGLILMVFHRNSAKTNFSISLFLLTILPFVAAYINNLKDSGWASMPELFPLYKSKSLVNVLWFGLKGTYVAQIISKPYLYTVHLLMFICMLWGHCLRQIKFFDNLKDRLPIIQKTFWTSLITTLLILGLNGVFAHFKVNVNHYFNLRYLGVVSTMLFVASSILWLYINQQAKTFFNALATIGKMTLTNYMIQNLIGLIVFSGVGFAVWNTQPIWFYVVLAIVVFTAQVYFSKWWLSRYQYGPIEWIWRSLSYGKLLAIKK